VVENLANNTSVYRKNKVIKTVESTVSERYSNIYLYVYIKDKTKRKKMYRNKKKVKKRKYKKKIAKKVNQKNQTRKGKYQGIYKKYERPWKMRKECRNTQKKCMVTKRIKMVNRHKKSMEKSPSEKNKRKDIVNNTGARKHAWYTESTLGKCTDSTLGKCTAQGIVTRNSVREGAWPICIRICVGKNVIRKYRAKNRVRKNKWLQNVVLIEISKMSNEPMEVPEAGGGDGVKGDGGKGNMYIQCKIYMYVCAYECTNNKYHREPSIVSQGPIEKWNKKGNSTQRVCNWYRRHGE